MVREHSAEGFRWEYLGDLDAGRPNLGLQAPVLAYRLMQFALRDVLASEMGDEWADEMVRKAGKVAGTHFCRHLLDLDAPLNEFVAQLQKVLREHSIGILRVEKLDPETLEMTVTVAEDLDCSGLPVTGATVCQYDEGFIAGVLEEYVGKPFVVREVDCWASGDRVCRFEVNVSGVE